jgi:type II secretory ATPase GspE/PulE/Tfp pilus assembly ATPase PilB-like protein
MMAMTPEIRQLLLRSASSGEIKEVARRDGMQTLTEDGWRVVREGATTVDEVLRVSKDEGANGWA